VSDKARKAIAVGFFVVAALACAWPFVGGSLPSILPDNAVTAVTYVYEKDDTAVPSGVRAGLNRLNRESKGAIVATEVDDDVIDGTDAIADHYKIAIPEARKAGLPALIVQSGDEVLNVVLAPKTEEQVWEAAR